MSKPSEAVFENLQQDLLIKLDRLARYPSGHLAANELWEKNHPGLPRPAYLSLPPVKEGTKIFLMHFMNLNGDVLP